MHIKSAEKSGELKEPSTLRKLRLGGSSARVPAQKETTESPLRAFVSAFGQSIGARTPLRRQGSTPSSAKNGAASSSTTSSGRTTTSNTGGSSHTPAKASLQSRMSNSASTPRKTFLSSSTALKKPSPPVTSSHTPASKQSSSSSSSYRSSASCSNIPKTPVARKGTTMPPKTPTSVSRPRNNPTTPVSKYSSIPTPAKRQSLPLTPISKQALDPKTPSTQRKQVNPTTPASKQLSVPPTTPVNYSSNARTPGSTYGSKIPFYTPKTALPGKSSLPSPLQPRNTNIPSESSRRLHFGINLSAMVDQENRGLSTPGPKSSYSVDPNYSVEKNRIAHMKARRNAFQKLLTSPAQRVRVADSIQSASTPHRPYIGDDCYAPVGAKGGTDVGNFSPTKRRVANSLF
ncbi:hypothetical protein R1flu_001178 [Riccia fluitans]|uniref:Uncharacterized protein n=1 Tax=Riccia fluitans TaxID=41844 RepID=A0ABD1Y2R3_9MARC